MKCASCHRELEVGDEYIEGTASEYLGQDVDPGVENIMAAVFGSGRGDKIVYCEDCTQEGGDFLLSTVYGDEDDE
jgi:hypothetical protein